jgi:Ran GTPase-activating protein (RanGAP) involved in mRNA processing and transport
MNELSDLFKFLKMKKTDQEFRNRLRNAIKTLLNKCIPPRVYVRDVIPVEVQLALLMKFAPDVRNILLLGDECSTEEKITCLCNAMQYAPTIQTVYISLFTTIPRPTWTLFGGMGALIRWAKQAPELQRLNIDGPIIGDDGVALLAEALKSRSTFHSLYLNNVGCSIVGAKAVTSLIDHKRNMRHVSLDNNAIGDEGVRDIVDSLSIADSRGSTAVRLLSLRGVEMTCATFVYVIRKGMDWAKLDEHNPRKTVTLRLTMPANASEAQSREIQNAVRDAKAREYLTLDFQ